MAALTYRASADAGSGGVNLSASVVVPNTVQVGDLIFLSVIAQENTRGWGGGIANTGAVPGFIDLSTAPGAVTLNGRSQYDIDDGVNPRVFWWIGYRIATNADTGEPTYTGSLTSSPAFGLGVGIYLCVYANPGGSQPVRSLAATLAATSAQGATVLAPATATPPGNSGTFLFASSSGTPGFRSAQTMSVLGGGGDLHVVCLPMGVGGGGGWVPPAALTSRISGAISTGPTYNVAVADGPTSSGAANLGRLPLLGAG